MIQKIRNSKASKIIACYLALMLILEIVAPIQAFALTEGPSQPEFNSFTPIGTSDMVSLTSGDLNYNIPIMDVGGYPINLAYTSGITMDQEASWVGLGWNLNVGQITRNVRGLPDDFRGDELKTSNNMRKNITIGVNPYINGQIIGALDNLSAGAGLNVQYNNYRGLSATPSFGMSFKITDNVAVGMQLTSSAEEGVSITPNVNVSLSTEIKGVEGMANSLSANISPSITYNSRQGLQNFNLATGLSMSSNYKNKFSGTLSSQGSGGISFVNNTFTPSKRLAFNNSNITFAFSLGPDGFGAHMEGSITAYASIQELKDKNVTTKAYGYEYTHLATPSDMLDFNREKEAATVSKNTLVLPITNYTYDLYSVEGQGISGQFRPHRGQIGYVFDPKVVDASSSDSFSLEAEGGAGAHVGFNFKTTETNTYTGKWDTNATPFLNEKISGNQKEYENVYYKMSGEIKTDDEGLNMLSSKLGNSSPITLALDANKVATNKYLQKTVTPGGYQANLTSLTSFNTLKRATREKRNTAVQKVTFSERNAIPDLQKIIRENSNSKTHHTAGYIVTDENGSRHVYGETAYNKEKHEVSFAVGNNEFFPETGLVKTSGADNSGNSKGNDHYFNKVTTPAYAHTYLLSSVLSSDYEDVTGNGPSDDDMGSYTEFKYEKVNDYKWRTPYNAGMASYNEGLKTIKGPKGDQRGSYIYGRKENKYLTQIITKTHVAYIDLKARKDGYGVDGEYGGGSASTTSRMYYIESIRLYSKPEITASDGVIYDPNGPGSPTAGVTPIKTAHFQYDYFLCQPKPGSTINNFNSTLNSSEIANQGGKLTLRKVYFTYRGSNMGKYTPYKFNYETTNNITNYKYGLKDYDVWGNYKPLTSDASFTNNDMKPTPQEFPYVNQTSTEVDLTKYTSKRDQQDKFASAWTLQSVDLPSGGKIAFTYETDDYKYVQNKRALQMFKIEGVSTLPTVASMTSMGSNLYGNGEAKYVVIKVDPSDTDTNINNYRQRYIGELAGKPIHFNFLLNMTNSDYEYITGYFEMDASLETAFVTQSGQKYIFIPMQFVNREGREAGSKDTNPISLAGWFFGRQNMNREVNGITQGQNWSDALNIVEVGKSIVNNLEEMANMFRGGNQRLRDKNCAKTFKKQKSWIRLQEPTGTKMGGGSRVKKVIIHDQWNTMLGISSAPDMQRYQKQYGQQYDYTLEDGSSSGVATYEPNVSKENPLITPFYHIPEKLSGRAYEETPFGESFYPSPTVTYSRVSVKNITAADDDLNPNSPVSKTRTGTVVTQHYTSYDFPTVSDFTPLNNDQVKRFFTNENEVVGNMLKGLLGLKINVNTDLTMTQGFTIQTNDMNGKLKKQEVYNNAGALISSVEHKYKTVATDNSQLNNDATVINEKGEKSIKAIGIQYDVINDFRESYVNTKSFGVGGNVDLIPVFIPIVVGFGVPERAEHTQILRTAVTTKVIHKTGLLEETIAYDLGSKVATKNVAWDANTGQVLLTETTNEFDDKYYSFNYPAYWYHKELSQAAENMDISGTLQAVANGHQPPHAEFGIVATPGSSQILPDTKKYLKIGDEIALLGSTPSAFRRVWVAAYATNPNRVLLMNRSGAYLTLSNIPNPVPFKVMRSGNQNMQKASMASVTSMINPILSGNITTSTFNYSSPSGGKKVMNASAIEYSADWDSQCECNMPVKPTLVGNPPYQYTYVYDPYINPNTPYNPFVYNVRNQWRPLKSYAYLTGRESSTNFTTRNSGAFNDFQPFYFPSSTPGEWTKTTNTSWKFASMVTKYSAKGQEIENADALNRYSSAQYGYNYTLPVAVSSNSRYQDMGYQGFEDYTDEQFNFSTHFGFSKYTLPVAACYTNPPLIVTEQAHTGDKSMKVGPGQNYVVCYMSDLSTDTRKKCYSFSPKSGQYVVSAWVKETGHSGQPKTYEKSMIRVENVSSGVQQFPLTATGEIIDGWQRIEGIIQFNQSMNPNGELRIYLVNLGSVTSYFDDLRIHPYNSTMKSFVYEATTQRLAAELDENNYATFYEYDKEGGLVRIKKETEKGVYTIQESRSGNPKVN